MALDDKAPQGKVLVLDLYIESSDFIFNYTGKLSKTIILTEAPLLEYAFRPIKGFFKPLRVSPPIASNEAVAPKYVFAKDDENKKWELKPVKLSGNT